MTFKVKRFISRSLLLSVILSNIQMYSKAEYLSDERYQTYLDNYIKVEDNYDIGKKDISIYGNTLVNLVDKYYSYYKTTDTADYIEAEKRDNGIRLDFNNESEFTENTILYMGNNFATKLKSDTEYTVYFEAKTNMDNVNTISIRNGDWTSPITNGDKFILYNGINKWKFRTSKDIEISPTDNQVVYLSLSKSNTISGKYIDVSNIMILEGDYIDEDIEYFEGMKSVGEKEDGSSSISMISIPGNENLIVGSDFTVTATKDQGAEIKSLKLSPDVDLQSLIGKTLTLSFDVHTLGEGKNNPKYPLFNNEKNSRFGIHCAINWSDSRGINSNVTLYPLVAVDNMNVNHKRVSVTQTITPPSGYDTINGFGFSFQTFRLPADNNDETWYLARPKLEYGNQATTWIPNYNEDGYKDYIKSIELSEPLRGLPNGVSDKIIKKNGSWYIERNCAEIILNGSENWFIDTDRNNDSTTYFRTYDFRDGDEHDLDYNKKTDFYINNKYIQNSADNNWSLINAFSPSFDINKSNIVSIRENIMTLSEFKAKLKANPVRVVYQLVNPVYERLSIPSTVELYEGISIISNDSVVPAKMDVIVDRVYNIAKRYIEVADLNPTTENISIARMWVNQIPDSSFKDLLQGELNDILSIADIVLEKKSVSSNIDLYIKFENALSLSLDTNSITFENFSGIEDLEKTNAVNLIVNSSLPYMVNAYLENEIQNSDKSKTMNKEILNIRANGESNYSAFVDTVTPIVLFDNQIESSNAVHGVDIKLEGGISHDKDVYKTTIKFEVNQK